MAVTDYIVKDYESFVEAMINFAIETYGPNTTYNRQWTNFNINDPNRIWLEIAAFVGDELMYYLDMQMAQSFITTTTVRGIMLDIAEQMDYLVPTASSAEGTATFTVNKSGTLEEGFRLKAANGEDFYCANSGGTTILAGAGTQDINVIQGTQREQDYVAEGVENERIRLDYKELVIDVTNSNSFLKSPKVIVTDSLGTNEYELVTSWGYSNSDDKHFKVRYNRDSTFDLEFGDNTYGRQLETNAQIAITYRTGGGTAGNIGIGQLTELVDSNSIIDSVTNSTEFSGGADEPSLESLRMRIPAHIRTLERAVSAEDYADIIIANFNQVQKATAERSEDNTEDVKVFVLPSGASITNITDNPALEASIRAFLNRRKCIGIVYSIENAYGIDIDIELEIKLQSNISAAAVQKNIEELFTDYFDLETGGEDEEGMEFAQVIEINNIYNLIHDNITGIDRFEIKKLSYKPRVDETSGSQTNYLISDIEILKDCDSAEYMIAIEENSDPYTAKVFKKYLCSVSAISDDFIQDNTKDFTLALGVATGGKTNEIFDNSQTFEVDEFNGEFLIDSGGNIFDVVATEAHSIITSGNAKNNASVTTPNTTGTYRVVKSFAGETILVRGLILSPIDYNTENAFYIEGEDFDDLAMIEDDFEISMEQSTVCTFGFMNSVANSGVGAPSGGERAITLERSIDSDVQSNPDDYVYVQYLDGNVEVFEITSATSSIVTIIDKTTIVAFDDQAPCSIAKRYYSDNNECSFVIALADYTYNVQSNATTPGIGSNPNEYGNDTEGDRIDHFVFRTSEFSDDIINLRKNEIMQITLDDTTTTTGNIKTTGNLKIKYLGGVS